MKKNIIIIAACIIIVALAILAYFLLKPTDDITITFNTDGGSLVNNLKIKKDEKIILPITEKEGFTFLGWYKDNLKIDENYKFLEDTTLTAKWDDTKKTYTVTFDSKGGSAVENITVECGNLLIMPANPTRSGYTFMSWSDKNGVTIHDQALLSCEDVTLYANWNKVEVAKTYTCPTGYKLNGTKCTIEGTVLSKCSGNRVFDYNDKCVTINNTVRKDTNSTCGSTTVHTGGGHTETVQGEIFKIGTNYCFFKVVTDSYEQNQSNCTSRGHYWNSQNNKCYYYRGGANEFVTSTCSHLTNYVHITNPNSYSGVNGLNGGCFPLSEKTKYCDSDYTLTNGKCVKTINATLK